MRERLPLAEFLEMAVGVISSLDGYSRAAIIRTTRHLIGSHDDLNLVAGSGFYRSIVRSLENGKQQWECVQAFRFTRHIYEVYVRVF